MEKPRAQYAKWNKPQKIKTVPAHLHMGSERKRPAEAESIMWL